MPTALRSFSGLCSLVMAAILVGHLSVVTVHGGQPSPTDSGLMGLIAGTPVLQSHRDAGAVILLKEIRMTVDEQRLVTRHVRVVGRLLDDKAVSDYSQISVAFNSYYDNAFLVRARTIRGDAVTEVSPDAVQIKTIPEAQHYSDTRSLAFSLPGLSKGAAFEYEVRIEPKLPIIERQWVGHVPLHLFQYGNPPRIDPVSKSRLLVDVPDGEIFTYRGRAIRNSPRVSTQGGRTVYVWEEENLAAIPVEAHMPPPYLSTPTVYLSSLKSWTELGKWAESLFHPEADPTPEIREMARDITKGAGTEEEKIRSIFYFVEEKITYIAAGLNRGGYRPHSAGEVLKNGYGDCKDQATLMVSLLRAADIEAYPVFLDSYGFRKIDREVPSPEFPHAIVYVRQKEGGYLWLDTTGGLTLFPFSQESNQGTLAFVVDGKTERPVVTPLSSPESNIGRMTITGSFSGHDYHTLLTIQAQGELNSKMKSMMRTATLDQQKDFVAAFLGTHFTKPHTIGQVEISDVNRPAIPLSIKAKVVFREVWKGDGPSYSAHAGFLPVLNFFSSLKELPRPEYRKGKFWMAYPFTLVMDELIPPPGKEMKPITIPRGRTVETPFFSFKAEYGKEGDSVRSRFTLSVVRGILDKGQYESFYRSIQDVLLRTEDIITFSSQKREVDQASLEEAVRQKADDIRPVVSLSKEYLARGRYKDARELLEKGVAMDPKNGEVHYFLGICLGYLDLYEESRAEIDRAKKLGYRP